MKRFLFVVNVDWFFLSHRLNIGLKLISMGYEVHIAAQGTREKNQSALQDYGFIFHNIPLERGKTNIVKEFLLFVNLCFLFKKLNPEIIHLVTIKPVVFGGIASRIVKSNAVVSAISGLGYVFTSKGIVSSIRRRLIGVLYFFATNHFNQKIIFQNNDDLNLVSKFNPRVNKKSVLIRGSGVDLSKYVYTSQSFEMPRVLMASRLLIDKGVFEYFKAAELAKEMNINIEFLLAGDIDLDNPNSLRALDLELIKESNAIEYIGYHNNISDLMATVNIVCLPSYREGFPKVLIEAAACGRAVITTDIPGCRDAILDGKTGYLVPVKDPKALLNAIVHLTTNKQLCLDMGSEARVYAEKKFDVDDIVKQHLEVYKSLRT